MALPLNNVFARYRAHILWLQGFKDKVSNYDCINVTWVSLCPKRQPHNTKRFRIFFTYTWPVGIWPLFRLTRSADEYKVYTGTCIHLILRRAVQLIVRFKRRIFFKRYFMKGWQSITARQTQPHYSAQVFSYWKNKKVSAMFLSESAGSLTMTSKRALSQLTYW